MIGAVLADVFVKTLVGRREIQDAPMGNLP